MREHRRYPRLHTYDINRIMQRIRMSETLSPKSYRRLHAYILSLEKDVLRLDMTEAEVPREETVYLN